MAYERTENLNAKPGQTVSVELGEMPSSGYLWTVESTGGAEISREPRAIGPDLGNIGGSVTAKFNMKAEKPGTYNIELIHSRPWEMAPHTRVRYTLTVAP
jgi:predicted secreted protein